MHFGINVVGAAVVGGVVVIIYGIGIGSIGAFVARMGKWFFARRFGSWWFCTRRFVCCMVACTIAIILVVVVICGDLHWHALYRTRFRDIN